MRQKPKPLFVTTAVVGKCRNVTHTLNTCSSHACTPFIYSLSTKYGDTEYYCVDCLDYRNGNTYNCEHVSNYNIINTFASACSYASHLLTFITSSCLNFKFNNLNSLSVSPSMILILFPPSISTTLIRFLPPPSAARAPPPDVVYNVCFFHFTLRTRLTSHLHD